MDNPEYKETDNIVRELMSRMRVAKPKKITVDIPQALYKETEKLVQERQITTSVFVREAMERYLRSIKRKKLERELEEGYSANSGISEQIHKEFEFVDAEQANDGE